MQNLGDIQVGISKSKKVRLYLVKGFQGSDHKEYHKSACPGCLGKMRKGPRLIMREANFETSDRGTLTEKIIGRAFSFL